MNAAELVHELQRRERRATYVRSARIRIIGGLGPLTVLAGIVWAILQPYRLTLLHPFDQGVYWLFAEPPLYVILAGVIFHFLIAPGLVEDLEEEG